MISTPNTYSHLHGYFFPKVKETTVSISGGNVSTEREVLLENRRWVYFGRLVLTVPVGVELQEVKFVFDNIPTHGETNLRIASVDLLPAATASGNTYTISADTFSSGGSVELVITGFVIKARALNPSSISLKAFYSVPMIYFVAS